MKTQLRLKLWYKNYHRIWTSLSWREDNRTAASSTSGCTRADRCVVGTSHLRYQRTSLPQSHENTGISSYKVLESCSENFFLWSAHHFLVDMASSNKGNFQRVNAMETGYNAEHDNHGKLWAYRHAHLPGKLALWRTWELGTMLRHFVCVLRPIDSEVI